MIFKVKSVSKGSASRISVRCPRCSQIGTFEGVGAFEDLITESGRFGQRVCPNPDCRAHMFVVLDPAHLMRVVVSYPALRLDFDSSDIPPKVVAALEEAITCHSQRCFTAGAIMVRKTLEELCDERGATGSDLRARLNDLRGKALLPAELVDGLHELRLLGNDAAHLELKHFDGISEEAVTLAIDVTKEVLKRVYQSGTLIERLRVYKKTS
jgi:phage FluMu protein Com